MVKVEIIEPNIVDLGKMNGFEDLSIIWMTHSCIVISMCWLVFLFMFAWAINQDKRDSKMNRVTYLADNKINDPHKAYYYLVTTMTDWRSDAGTTASVVMYINGSKHSSDKHLLHDQDIDNFQVGSEDSFLLSEEGRLGDLESIVIWNDCIGLSPAWYLNQVTIRDLQTGEKWDFICDGWITPDSDQGFIRRHIKVSTKQPWRYRLRILSLQALRSEHILMSVFTRPPNSTFTRCQRLACGFSFLLMGMTASIMYFKDENKSMKEYSIWNYIFDIDHILITLQSSVYVIPVNLLFVGLFCEVRGSEQPVFVCSNNLKSRSSVCSSNADSETEDCSCENKDDAACSKVHRTNEEVEYSDVLDQTTKRNLEVMMTDRQRRRFGLRTDAVGKKSLQFIEEFALNNMNTDTENPISLANEKVNHGQSLAPRLIKNFAHLKEKFKINYKLPWWAIYHVWALVMGTCISLTYVLVQYGVIYGKSANLEWLMAASNTFTHLLFVMQPIKIVYGTIVYALLFNKQAGPCSDISQLVKVDAGSISKIKTKKAHGSLYQIPSMNKIYSALIRLNLERTMTDRIRGINIYAVLTALLVLLSSGQLQELNFLSNRSLINAYSIPQLASHTKLQEVNTIDAIWSYINTTLDYTLFTPDVSMLTRDGVNILIGSVRVRQQRKATDNSSRFDKSPNITTTVNLEGAERIWTLQKPHFMHNFIGMITGTFRDVYTAEGYQYFAVNSSELRLVSEDLQKYDWLDEGTNVLFIEFSVYNMPHRLFSNIIVMFEFSPSKIGRLSPSIQVYSARLFYLQSFSDVFLMISAVLIYVLITVKAWYITPDLIDIFNKYGLRLICIRKGLFLLPDIVMLIFINLTLILYVIRSELMAYVLRHWTPSARLPEMDDQFYAQMRFVHFYPLVVVNQALMALMASMTAIALVNTLQILALNRTAAVMLLVVGHLFRKWTQLGPWITVYLVAYCFVMLVTARSQIYGLHNVSLILMNAANSLLLKSSRGCDEQLDFVSNYSFDSFIGRLLLAFTSFVIVTVVIPFVKIFSMKTYKNVISRSDKSFVNHMTFLYFLRRRLYHWFGLWKNEAELNQKFRNQRLYRD